MHGGDAAVRIGRLRWQVSGVVALMIVAIFGWMALLATPAAAHQDAGAGRGGVIRFAAVGDSITQGDSPDFSIGWTGSLSWVTYAKSPTLVFAGGWALGGAKSANMAANVGPVKADVLVILAGTNDLAVGVPFQQTVANLEHIAETVGAPRVIVSAVPPRNSAPDTTVAFNAALRAAVVGHGWTWTDAPAGLRAGTRYVPGLTRDGVHPNAAGADVLGKALAAAMRQAMG
ncbi:SGNH/GDSL hydrolase family protein [Sinomonas albida]|uniref:SGNH/GDSL hydrolase family protein n=1 Tax=Sinomonas albida TaxID=369942 RepID=UPI00301AF572